MNKEIELSTYISDENDRKAVINKDEYHYVVRLYEIKKNGNLCLYATRLVYNKALQFAEDLAENFVKKYGEFKTLEKLTRKKYDRV